MLALGACAHNVPQDKATGKDGNIKGAVPIALENNQGESVGIVTYPGGDRVDWRKIELPAGKHGKLDLTMTYTTPRPGLKVAFDVFDQWRTPLAKAAYQHEGHSRSASIDHAKGTYLVRVYAPKRGDAGKYRLVADFTEDPPPPPPGFPNLVIPDPPRLAEVPPVENACDPFDTKNPTCARHCDITAPANWGGCSIECPDPADAKFEKCKHTMACNSALPDARIDACNAPKPPPPPPPPHAPVTGRVIKVSMDGNGDLLVWIGVGSAQGVDKAWAGKVLRSGTEQPLSGGNATIIQVNKTTTELRVHLTADVMSANDQIRVAP